MREHSYQLSHLHYNLNSVLIHRGAWHAPEAPRLSWSGREYSLVSPSRDMPSAGSLPRVSLTKVRDAHDSQAHQCCSRPKNLGFGCK